MNNEKEMTIQEKIETAKNTNEFLDYLIKIVEKIVKGFLLSGLQVVKLQIWKFTTRKRK